MLVSFVRITIAGILSCGCVHAVKVSTTPNDAEIYTVRPDGEPGNLLGKTPFVLQSNPDEDYFYITVDKPGFLSRVVILPFYRSSKNVEEFKISMKTQNKNWFQNALRTTYVHKTDAIIREFLTFQDHIIKENDQECLRYIENLGKTYSKVATFHSLVGAYYWKKNRLYDAKRAYLRLLELMPSDPEAERMLNVLETMLGS